MISSVWQEQALCYTRIIKEKNKVAVIYNNYD